MNRSPCVIRRQATGRRATSLGNVRTKTRPPGYGLSDRQHCLCGDGVFYYTDRFSGDLPAAELAASHDFEISAPPEVSIVRAALLAGRPKPEAKKPALPAVGHVNGSAMMKERQRRRPSFDSIGGGYPTVDLHVRRSIRFQVTGPGWSKRVRTAGLPPRSSHPGLPQPFCCLPTWPDPNSMLARRFSCPSLPDLPRCWLATIRIGSSPGSCPRCACSRCSPPCWRLPLPWSWRLTTRRPRMTGSSYCSSRASSPQHLSHRPGSSRLAVTFETTPKSHHGSTTGHGEANPRHRIPSRRHT